MHSTATWLLLATVTIGLSTGARAQTEDMCGLAPGRQARISEIHVPKGMAATVEIERIGRLYRVSNNCLLRGGDVVRPQPGSTVVVVMPLGPPAFVEGGHILFIPVDPTPGRTGALLAVLKSILGDDIEMAHAMANVRMAQSRTLAQPDPAHSILIPGLPAVMQQDVIAGRGLLLHWSGGAGPYRVTVRESSGREVVTESLPGEGVEIPPLAPGNYTITVSCAGCAAVDVPLRAVGGMPPSAPEVEALGGDDGAAAEAAWLLVSGPQSWRLEALSELQRRARDKADTVAQAILAPD